MSESPLSMLTGWGAGRLGGQLLESLIRRPHFSLQKRLGVRGGPRRRMEGRRRQRGAPETAEQLRAAVRDLIRDREFGRAATLLEACRIEEKGDIMSLWYEVHYMKLKDQLGMNSLTAVQRFRCRKRNPPPRTLCPDELKTRSLPPEARQHLRAWAEGNTVTPSIAEREELIKETGLEKQQIYNWFANYRRRQRRVNSQREHDGELRHTTIDYSESTHRWSARCPQVIIRGSTRLPISGDYTAADVPCVVKEEQVPDQRTRGIGYTAAQRPTLPSPQCCLLGLPSHQLFLPEGDPVALLNAAAASSYWCRPLNPPSTLAQPNLALCRCLSTAADLAHPCPMMDPPQPAYPDGLLRYALSGGSNFERAADFEQYYLSEELLNQDSSSLYNSSQMLGASWQVPLPTFPNNASQYHSFNNLFLTNGQQSDIRAALKEETVTDGYLQRSPVTCPVGTGYSARDVSQTEPEGSIGDQSGRGWLKVSASKASRYLAPVLDEGSIKPSAGYSVGDPEESPAESELVLCAVAGDKAETCGEIQTEGLNRPSQWTHGAVSADASPQSNLEHVEIDCRRLTDLKVESEKWCNPDHGQVQQDTKLDIAAQALIQLSQRPAGAPSV